LPIIRLGEGKPLEDKRGEMQEENGYLKIVIYYKIISTLESGQKTHSLGQIKGEK
jgi:hypothetical protein